MYGYSLSVSVCVYLSNAMFCFPLYGAGLLGYMGRCYPRKAGIQTFNPFKAV